MGSAKKQGRDKERCSRYRSQGRRLKNKIRKLMKHLKNCPCDVQAEKALERLLG